MHELNNHTDELLGYLSEMQRSYTKDILTSSATNIEASDVWKGSTVLREWFQTYWLPLAKVYFQNSFFMICIYIYSYFYWTVISEAFSSYTESKMKK